MQIRTLQKKRESQYSHGSQGKFTSILSDLAQSRIPESTARATNSTTPIACTHLTTIFPVLSGPVPAAVVALATHGSRLGGTRRGNLSQQTGECYFGQAWSWTAVAAALLWREFAFWWSGGTRAPNDPPRFLQPFSSVRKLHKIKAFDYVRKKFSEKLSLTQLCPRWPANVARHEKMFQFRKVDVERWRF